MAERVDILFPDTQQEGTESVVSTWLKKIGDVVKEHDPIVEISTDKVNVEISSPTAGVLVEIIKLENDSITPGDVLGRIEVGTVSYVEKASTTPAPESNRRSTSAPAAKKNDVELSPAVRRYVWEYNIDISQVQGTGKGGRITYDDVVAFNEKSSDRLERPTDKNNLEPIGASTLVPHTPRGRSMAKAMVDSMLHTAPHVTAVFQADFSRILAHREEVAPGLAREGIKLTLTAYFVAAACEALKSVPEVNSRWHDDALELFNDCNIGIGTATEQGLIVPVIRKAQLLSLREIASKLGELTDKARQSNLRPSDVQGGTFTITNHGVSGTLLATPIILQPQSAILGIGKLERRPVVQEIAGEEQIVIRSMAFVTLTIDHRVLDGGLTNKFLAKFVDVLENWPEQTSV